MDWPVNWLGCSHLSTAELGRLGEDEAARFLSRRHVEIIARNVLVEKGELDLIARVDGKRTAVEVRSVRRNGASSVVPLDAFDSVKAMQVRKLAAAARCRRVDLICVSFHPGGMDLHWVPEIS